MFTDPIADYLTRVRNAQVAGHKVVDIPASNMKKSITEILFDKGYILSYKFEDEVNHQGNIKIALKYKPNFVCIVPEKRSEITTEGGLNLNRKKSFLKKIVMKLKQKNIRVSLFIEPKISDIQIAKKLNVCAIELHTGKYCNLFKRNKNVKSEFHRIFRSALYAKKNRLRCSCGSWLDL